MTRAQVAYLDFQNGTGARFLTMYGQDYISIGSCSLFYTFQGLTSDGRYYISAILPVAPPPLAVCEDLPCDDFQALVEKWDLYLQSATGQLNAENAASFMPDLTRLDTLIRSLRVK